MRFFPKFILADEIPEEILKRVRNAELYNNIGGTYCFNCKTIYIKKNTGQGLRLVMHELGHWLIALFTKSHKIHTWYDSRHLKRNKPTTNS